MLLERSAASTQESLHPPIYLLLNCRYPILCCCRAGKRKYNLQRLRTAPNLDLGAHVSTAPGAGAVCKDLHFTRSSFLINDTVLLCDLPTWPSLYNSSSGFKCWSWWVNSERHSEGSQDKWPPQSISILKLVKQRTYLPWSAF